MPRADRHWPPWTSGTLFDIENLTGSAGQDRLTGDAGDSRLDGSGGNDTLIGLGGSDALLGGVGIDTVDYEGSTACVTVNLVAGIGKGGDAEGDTLTGIEVVLGSASGDDLAGAADDNSLRGNAGDDILEGGAGRDVLDGGDGLDLAAYRGGDSINIDLALGFFSDLVAADQFNNIEGFIGSDAGGNVLKGDDANNVFLAGGGQNFFAGRGGDDTLTGGSGVDRMRGGGGSDMISGQDGADRIDGDAGNDTLDDGTGKDILDGGNGNDLLAGGDGRDVFVFSGRTFGQVKVTDFKDGLDIIPLSNAKAPSFADFAIAGNGTDHVILVIGGQSIDVHGDQPISLTSADFSFL
ncbi:calcium-binding protein [Aestuariivirga sp.]|uniref:calcium-binding protein n=1 Tax=Aestuariivirga sp. TaxID=2650926 RepID=UPI0035940334